MAPSRILRLVFTAASLVPLLAVARMRRTTPSAQVTTWKIGTPIISYYCGPVLTDAVARQMAEGGWNLVWGSEAELDIAQRHGLRLQLSDGLLTPAVLENPRRREQLDALIARVRKHPALYAYYLADEPGVGQFPAIRKLVAYLHEKDPAHLAYINVLPIYASNAQLGIRGEVVAAYREYLREFVEVIEPELISYDHYQFALAGDNSQYFLNLDIIRRLSLETRTPFLNIVQASNWAPAVMRTPGPDEVRFLAYTTLAYGAQGISYYVYTCANHRGGIANADGKPTPLYTALKTINREFVAIAQELQPLHSLGVYHAGMIPEGAITEPSDAAFRLNPMLRTKSLQPSERAKGVVVGLFGPVEGGGVASATHALVVNLDYRSTSMVGIEGQGPIEVYDAVKGQWSNRNALRVDLKLPGGGGKLVRVR
jgi:hypothetical protein